MQFNSPVVEVTTATVLATYRCTAACQNCCFDCHPKVKGRLSLEQIKAFIDEVTRLGTVQVLVFSGGECFLLGGDLIQAIQYASERGLSTRCVTNGYWARRRVAGLERIAALVEAGLNELNISTGDFHQKYVPQSAVINAAIAGVQSGLDNTMIIVETTDNAVVTRDTILADVDLKLLWESTERTEFDILSSAWMPMSADEVIPQSGNTMLNKETVHNREGCNDILSTLVLTPSTKIGICCGLPREKIPDLNFKWEKGHLHDGISAQNQDFMKIWLHIDGPEKILAWAASKNPNIDWENRYAHHCHACLALFDDPLVRDTILTHYSERVDDVLMRFSLKTRMAKTHLAMNQLAETVYGI